MLCNINTKYRNCNVKYECGQEETFGVNFAHHANSTVATTITGCIKTALSIGKRQISTPQEAKTYVSICMKLGMVDYLSDSTPHAKFGGRRSTYVV